MFSKTGLTDYLSDRVFELIEINFSAPTQSARSEKSRGFWHYFNIVFVKKNQVPHITFAHFLNFPSFHTLCVGKNF